MGYRINVQTFFIVIDFESCFVLENRLFVVLCRIKGLLLLSQHTLDDFGFVVWQFKPGLLLEVQGDRVNLVSQPIRLWTVCKHVAKVGFTL